MTEPWEIALLLGPDINENDKNNPKVPERNKVYHGIPGRDINYLKAIAQSTTESP